MKNEKIEKFLDDLIFVDPKYKEEIKTIEEKYKCKIYCDIEKHNALQLTYFYEVDFNLKKKFYVEIESGINNGTQINSADWELNTKSKTKEIEVLKDVVLDEDYYEENSLLKQKAQIILNRYKKEIFEFERMNNYDNYVTGGNSKLTIENELLKKLHLDYIYETKEVDCTFI